MEPQTTEQAAAPTSGSMKIVGIVIVIAIIGAIAWYATKGSSATKTESVAMTKTEVATSPAGETKTTTETANLKNGTYKAEGAYQSPGGDETIDVSVTIENGVVKDAEVTPKATRPKSIFFQGKFKDGFKEQVVGKPIDKIALTVVNGSSLTPKGFMDALKKIEDQAKA